MSGVKLNGAVFFNAEFSGPWRFASPASQTLACTLAPGAPHVVIYHLLTEGCAIAQTADGQAIALEPGDVVIFPHGDAHLIRSTVGPAQSEFSSEIMQKLTNRDLTPLRVGGGGETARFVCGFMACDPHLGRPILNGLPSVFKVNVRTDRSGQWLRALFCIWLRKRRLAEWAAMRCWRSFPKLFSSIPCADMWQFCPSTRLDGSQAPVTQSWVEASDLLHRKVDYPWTIADLASQVGLSRSALAERFIRYLSEPPMIYLTRWRLQLAAHSLVHTSKGVVEIASDVGYESESAFNRAFKREFALPPAQYRREQRNVSPTKLPIL